MCVYICYNKYIVCVHVSAGPVRSPGGRVTGDHDPPDTGAEPKSSGKAAGALNLRTISSLKSQPLGASVPPPDIFIMHLHVFSYGCDKSS